MNLFKNFDRYLARNVFLATLMALLILISIDSIIDLINDLEAIGKRGFTFADAMLKLLLGMPQRLYEFMPTALLLGSLIGLGNLAANSELVALRALGISKLRILWSVLKIGAVLILVSVWVGESIAPVTEGYARSLTKTSSMDQISMGSDQGLWIRDGSKYINVTQLFPDYRMTGISVYELDEKFKLKRASYAKSAVFENDSWHLFDVKHSVIFDTGVTTIVADEENWQRLVSPELFDVVTVEPESMGAKKLIKYVNYLDDNELDSRRYQLAFYNRFAVPLSGLAMLLIAIPFVFRAVRTGGLGQRIVLGMVIAVVFHLLSKVLSNASVVYDIQPIIGAFLPVTLMTMLALFALKKMA